MTNNMDALLEYARSEDIMQTLALIMTRKQNIAVDKKVSYVMCQVALRFTRKDN